MFLLACDRFLSAEKVFFVIPWDTTWQFVSRELMMMQSIYETGNFAKRHRHVI